MEKIYNNGVYPTMITPYKKDGSVDLDNAEKLVEWYFKKGCNGIFALCHSSEVWNLSLEERIALNTRVRKKVKELEKEYSTTFTMVTSGHTPDDIETQAYELSKIYETGTDAIIFMSNRLDLNQEGDDVWLRNAEKLLKLLPEEINLGVYETPYPYKRLLTPKILRWCVDTGRFYFLKDTCCNIEMIKERLDIMRGTHFKLMNANAQTLLESLRYGASGYSSVMSSFHPELYAWLCASFDKEPEKAERLQEFLGTIAFTESGLPYPLTAKYNLTLEGIPLENISRIRKSEDLRDYDRDCVKQMRSLAYSYPKLLGIEPPIR